ncbi:MAG: winged helix-turn-helix transcriptional regulator [Nitrospirae bacterium]|nr:winged helix-turn-helix transcriptional regulator [Nitrospirota bacterium]
MKKSHSHSLFDWEKPLKALADETRLKIIRKLLNNESSVNELSNALGIQTYNISRHLKILEAAGLVEKRKAGANRIIRITRDIRSYFSEDNVVLDLGCCKFKFSDSEK